MSEKDVVGIYRDRFINLMKDAFGIVDFKLVDQIYNAMVKNKEKMTCFFSSLFFNYLKNHIGVIGEYDTSDLDFLICEFSRIVLDLKEKKKDCKN